MTFKWHYFLYFNFCSVAVSMEKCNCFLYIGLANFSLAKLVLGTFLKIWSCILQIRRVYFFLSNFLTSGLSRMASTLLKRNIEGAHSTYFCDFRRKTFSLSYLGMIITIGSYINPLFQVEKIPLFSYISIYFYREWKYNFINIFASVEVILGCWYLVSLYSN